MGSNKNAPAQTAKQGQSGGDPRGRSQNQGAYQQNRFENQQGPTADYMGENYGRATELGFKDYGDIMGQYRNMMSGGGSNVNFKPIGYTDPFKSYGGYEDFSKTGGYTPQDVSAMRARGVAPIRAAYENAGREVGRQRSLQGGYSPNAIGAQVKMAREQGQAGADAATNVEAQLGEMRNQGKRFGLTGMTGVEGQRLNADLDVGRFNSTGDMQAQMANRSNQLGALQGMASLYGTAPGMASQFGNQLLNSIGQGASAGQGFMGNEVSAGNLPGAWDQTTGRINDVANAAYPWLDYLDKRNKNPNQQTTQKGGANPTGVGPTQVPDWFRNPQTGYDNPYGYGYGGGFDY